MRKLKLYLDTSVISHLDQPEKPVEREHTHLFWEQLKQGKYEVYISPLVIEELERCNEPKLSTLLGYLAQIDYHLLESNDDVVDLSYKYLQQNILKKKSRDDCVHIAYASVYECDAVVSWNMSHLVNVKTESGVRIVNAAEGYREMRLHIPSFYVEGEDEDE